MHSELDQSYAYCQQLARSSGSTFFLAFRCLPREMFREMCVLYAFMRQTDDLGDAGIDSPDVRRQHLSLWRKELNAALQGEYVSERGLTALADVALKRQIPGEYLHEVITGVEADLSPRAFETFEELEHYCYQVAGVVGLCCLRVWGYTGDVPHAAAVACGTAFQLTNILRDLGEDAARGRIYLPREDLAVFGYSPEDLQQRRRNDCFERLMRFQAERAWHYYDLALPLRHQLSDPGRRIFLAFFDLYSSLLERIERARYDVFTQRIHLSRWKKGVVALRCLLRLTPPPGTLADLADRKLTAVSRQ